MRVLAIIALLMNLWFPAYADELGQSKVGEMHLQPAQILPLVAAPCPNPNPNATPYSASNPPSTAKFSDGCPLPSAGLNAIAPHLLAPGTYNCATVTVGADQKITIIGQGNCSGAGPSSGNCILASTGNCLLVNTGSILLIK